MVKPGIAHELIHLQNVQLPEIKPVVNRAISFLFKYHLLLPHVEP